LHGFGVDSPVLERAFMEQVIRLALAALSQSAPPNLQRPVSRMGWSAGLIFLVVLATATGTMCLLAALWLGLQPEIGATAATACIGAVFLVIAVGLYLGYRAKTAAPSVASPAMEGAAEIQQLLTETLSKNVGPLLIAAILAGVVAGFRRGR
jgi:hypothetical protein